MNSAVRGTPTWLVFSLLVSSCSWIGAVRASSSDIMQNVLLASGWRSAGQLAAMSHDDMRNTLIVELGARSTNSVSWLQARSDEQLAIFGLQQLWLVESMTRTKTQLDQSSIEDQRNTVITVLHRRTGEQILVLQGLDDWELLYRVNGWWLPDRLWPLIEKLEGVTSAAVKVHNLSDSAGRGMDTLKVCPIGDRYWGIYHTKLNGVFELRVAESRNLSTWTEIAFLGRHQHQGDLRPMGKGFLVVNEEDSERGNQIRLRYFAGPDQLRAGVASRDRRITRTFAPSAEGTPHIEQIVGEKPDNSEILIGFHYFRDRVVDRQAMGVLLNFDRWKAWKNVVANRALDRMGFRGNFGGRYGFQWDGGRWFVQEAQLRRTKFETWRMVVGNGRFYTWVYPETAGGSRAFGNPSVTVLPDGRFVVTSFLFGEAAAPGESGELLYAVR